MSDRDDAIRALAENQLRRYDAEFDASHLSWQDFSAEAEEDLDTMIAAGYSKTATPAIERALRKLDTVAAILQGMESARIDAIRELMNIRVSLTQDGGQ